MRHASSAFAIGTLPSPESRPAAAGATSHASAAIGKAAAAQIAKIARRPSCGISTAESAAREGIATSVTGNETLISSPPSVVEFMRRP